MARDRNANTKKISGFQVTYRKFWKDGSKTGLQYTLNDFIMNMNNELGGQGGGQFCLQFKLQFLKCYEPLVSTVEAICGAHYQLVLDCGD